MRQIKYSKLTTKYSDARTAMSDAIKLAYLETDLIKKATYISNLHILLDRYIELGIFTPNEIEEYEDVFKAIQRNSDYIANRGPYKLREGYHLKED